MMWPPALPLSLRINPCCPPPTVEKRNGLLCIFCNKARHLFIFFLRTFNHAAVGCFYFFPLLCFFLQEKNYRSQFILSSRRYIFIPAYRYFQTLSCIGRLLYYWAVGNGNGKIPWTNCFQFKTTGY